jgi:hypothetical protein
MLRGMVMPTSYASGHEPPLPPTGKMAELRHVTARSRLYERICRPRGNLIPEPQPMCFIRSMLAAVVILGIVTSGVALAQTNPRREHGRLNIHSTARSSSTSSKLDDVSKWTMKQWKRAKAEWAAEKVFRWGRMARPWAGNLRTSAPETREGASPKSTE